MFRGHQPASELPREIGNLFFERLHEVWYGASERARVAAWSAWEATEGTRTEFWKDMKAKLDEAQWDSRCRLVGDPAILDKLDEIRYAEAYHGYGGKESVWLPRWESAWAATWDQVWNRSWPPFCWETSRELPDFEEWRIPTLADQWNRLVAEERERAWSFGRWSSCETGLDRIFADECKLWVQQATAVVTADIFQDPFSPVVCEPAWRTDAVVEFARSIYDRHDFNRLSEVAKMLEDVGCDDETLLTHLRFKGPHVRGCWALDLVAHSFRSKLKTH